VKYIRFLNEVSRNDVADVGGKAASLGDMVKGGLTVTAGFVVAVQAFQDFNGAEITEQFQDELRYAFRRLKAKRVAVRSSAVAEDAGDASWAGQLETYLNVSEAGLVQAIRKCWSSMNSERAIAYAIDKNVSEADRSVGVVVQKMIDSEVSGVMFTYNPVTKNKRQLMIEAVYGLGEMIVGGIVTPDSYLVNRRPLEVVEFDISIKDKMLIFSKGSNRVVDVPEAMADKASLREDQVLQLAKLGLKVEKHYRKPQDIEWAHKNGQFYITQARPITTL
jgi:phosphoenolpyruvate synthase/pyruvate phosphate dikinase